MVLERKGVGWERDEVGRPAVEVVEEGGVGAGSKEAGYGDDRVGGFAGGSEVERGGEGGSGGAIGVDEVGAARGGRRGRPRTRMPRQQGKKWSGERTRGRYINQIGTREHHVIQNQ